MVSPVWILWIMRAKLTDWGGSALSEATVAALRVEASFSLGLWQSTHISIWLRFRSDLVDHEGEVDGLGRQRLVGGDGGGTAGGSIVFARIVAEHAHFDLVAVPI